MSSIVDVWRAVDPEALLLGGTDDQLRTPVRAVQRTRAAPPHLPTPVEGALLMADAALVVGPSLDRFLAAVGESGLEPPAIVLGGVARHLEPPHGGVPMIASALPVLRLADAAQAYLGDERGSLERLAMAMRLAAAEAALADPSVGAAAGVVSARLRRGVAVVVDRTLRSLNPRPAGRALAARFAAAHVRLLADARGPGEGTRQLRDGLWVMQRPVRDGAVVWLFDDVPFARVDAAAAEALAITVRALLRRPAPAAHARDEWAHEPVEAAALRASGRGAPRLDDPLGATLLAVARANGRIAPAARALGVHRNTVLYRLRVARGERGLDPRRAEDALRILRAAERSE